MDRNKILILYGRPVDIAMRILEKESMMMMMKMMLLCEMDPLFSCCCKAFVD